MPSPPGYNPTALVNQTEVVRDQRLVIKKSWDLALGPLKQVCVHLQLAQQKLNPKSDTVSRSR